MYPISYWVITDLYTKLIVTCTTKHILQWPSRSMQKVTNHSTQHNVIVKKDAGSSECMCGRWDNHDPDVPQLYCWSGRSLMYARLQHGYHAAVNCLDLCYVAFAFENCNAFHTFNVPRFPVPRFQRCSTIASQERPLVSPSFAVNYCCCCCCRCSLLLMICAILYDAGAAMQSGRHTFSLMKPCLQCNV